MFRGAKDCKLDRCSASSPGVNVKLARCEMSVGGARLLDQLYPGAGIGHNETPHCIEEKHIRQQLSRLSREQCTEW
jgi:hypothetical protein